MTKRMKISVIVVMTIRDRVSEHRQREPRSAPKHWSPTGKLLSFRMASHPSPPRVKLTHFGICILLCFMKGRLDGLVGSFGACHNLRARSVLNSGATLRLLDVKCWWCIL